MKRIVKVLAVVAIMVMAAACGSASSPEKVVEKCWKQLSKGNIDKAIELIDVTKDEVATYRALYADVCRSLEVAGGMDKFEVVSSSEAEAEAEALVEATVTLRSGQQITQQYDLVKVGKEWKLKE